MPNPLFLSHLCSPSMCSSKGKTRFVFDCLIYTEIQETVTQKGAVIFLFVAFCSLTLVIRSGTYTSNYTQTTEASKVEMRVLQCIILNAAVHPVIHMSRTAVWSAQII